MSDLISRSKLIEEIKNDLALKYTGDVSANFISGMITRQYEIIDIINNLPTVETVPVVRCKNCKHWGTGVAGETEHIKCCEYGKYMVGENGYCVYGEWK